MYLTKEELIILQGLKNNLTISFYRLKLFNNNKNITFQSLNSLHILYIYSY